MFDIGWQELMVIGIVAVVVIGPKDLPRVLRTVTMAIRKLRGMARDFQDSIDELAREAELHDLRKEIEQAADADLEKELQTIADPAREMEKSVQEIGQSLKEQAAADPEMPAEPATPAESDAAAPEPASEAPAPEPTSEAPVSEPAPETPAVPAKKPARKRKAAKKADTKVETKADEAP